MWGWGTKKKNTNQRKKDNTIAKRKSLQNTTNKITDSATRST